MQQVTVIDQNTREHNFRLTPKQLNAALKAYKAREGAYFSFEYTDSDGKLKTFVILWAMLVNFSYA